MRRGFLSGGGGGGGARHVEPSAPADRAADTRSESASSAPSAGPPAGASTAVGAIDPGVQAHLCEFGLELRHGSFGRHVFALRGFKPGEEVLRSEALAAVVDGERAAEACHACLRPLEGPRAALACPACSRAWYCSPACLEADLPEHGAAECRLPPAPPAPAAVRLVRRIVAIARGARRVGAPQPGCRRDAENARRWRPTTAGSAWTWRRRRRRGPRPLPGALAAHFARLRLNAYAVARADDFNERLGYAIHPLGVLINHSCAPSCLALFDGRAYVCRAMRHIAAGAPGPARSPRDSSSRPSKPAGRGGDHDGVHDGLPGRHPPEGGAAGALRRGLGFVCACEACRGGELGAALEAVAGRLEEYGAARAAAGSSPAALRACAGLLLRLVSEFGATLPPDSADLDLALLHSMLGEALSSCGNRAVALTNFRRARELLDVVLPGSRYAREAARSVELCARALAAHQKRPS
eukprot:tig00020604_g11855.t1